MAKKTSGGTGSMLLLAGLGIGAFMLFSGKSNAAPTSAMPADGAEPSPGSDIPAAPNILAVNSSDTESPIPTGIVSDEEGMVVRTIAAGQRSSGYDADEEDDSRTIPVTKSSAGSSKLVAAVRKSQGADVPALISTKLTPKEKAIIDKGLLTNDLALQRPDLYKAIYVKKNKGKGQAALKAADAAIQAIQLKAKPKSSPASQKHNRKVAIKLNPKAVPASTKAGKAVQKVKSAAVASRAVTKKAPPTKPTGKPSQRRAAVKRPAAKRPTAAVARKHR